MPEQNAGQEPTPTPDPAEATPSTELGSDGKPFDAARAMATIEKLRGFESKSKEQERQIADLQAKIQEHENAKLSDIERLQGKLSAIELEKTQWERERQELRVSTAVREAASRAGALYPDALYRLVDPAELDFEDDGTPKKLDKLIEQMRSNYPAMFSASRPGSGDGGARGGSNGVPAGADMNAIIRQAAGRQ